MIHFGINQFSRPRNNGLVDGVRFTLLAWACLLTSSFSAAAPITVYTQATVNLRDCESECFNMPGDPSLALVGDMDYESTGSSSTHVMGPLRGTESGASAGFSGTSFTPTLSAYALTTGSYRFTTGAFGIQRYEFIAPGTVTIGGILTFSQSGIATTAAEYPISPAGRIGASFFSFQMENDVFDLDDCSVTNADFITFGKTPALCSLSAGQTIGGVVTVSLPGQRNFQSSNFVPGNAGVADGVLQNYLSVTGNTGDVFFLGSTLNSFAHLGGFSDSRNTLRLTFDNPSLVKAAFTEDTFSPAPVSVPEPVSAIMLLSGLICLRLAGRPPTHA